MTYHKGDPKYDYLNRLTGAYINALHKGAPHEELHYSLRDLLAEAIKREITLKHLLGVLSGSSIEESDTEKFIEDVSTHYAYGVIAARVKNHETGYDALKVIQEDYKALIKSNSLVRADFQQLLECFKSSNSQAKNRCNKIISHLIGEVNEGANDYTRMSDESPVAENQNETGHRHEQKHIALKRALENFKKTHLDHSA